MLCQSNWCTPRIAVRRTLRHTVRTWAVVGKNDWQFSNPRIDTAAHPNSKLGADTKSSEVKECHIEEEEIVR